jgi:hypothetical protein
MVSRARKEARERGIFRPRYAGRRPRGAVPLRHAPRRFEVGFTYWLTTMRGVGLTNAAQLGAAAFHKDSVVVLAANGVSFEYKGGSGESEFPLEIRTKKHAREVAKLIAAADGDDQVWLVGSAYALHGAFNAVALGDVNLFNGFILVLKRLGWGDRIDRIRKLLGAREGLKAAE